MRILHMLLNFRPDPRLWHLACEGNNETLKTKEKPKKTMNMPKIKSQSCIELGGVDFLILQNNTLGNFPFLVENNERPLVTEMVILRTTLVPFLQC